MKIHIGIVLIVAMVISCLAIGGRRAEAGVVTADSCDDFSFWPQLLCTAYCEGLDCDTEIPHYQILRRWLCKSYEDAFVKKTGIEPPCDVCPGEADVDTDGDGTPDCVDGCQNDPLKTDPGVCGCGVSDDNDADGDGFCAPEDCNDSDPDIRPNRPGEMRVDVTCNGKDIDCSQPYGGCEPKANCFEKCGGGDQECGEWDAGCGVFVECGECNSGGIGFRTCVDGRCCQPTSTECVIQGGGSCPDRINDGCGRILTCPCANGGTCVDGECTGGGGCIPFCAADAQCGDDDRCGGGCFGPCPGGVCVNTGPGYACQAITQDILSCSEVDCGLCDSGQGILINKPCDNGADCKPGNSCDATQSACDRPCTDFERCNSVTRKCECCDIFGTCSVCIDGQQFCSASFDGAACCGFFTQCIKFG